ncbi:meiotic recombination protein REC8 homolog [Polymixia lowei]
MFFYPTVLQRHTGCFSTIWLTATKGVKLSRRDYLKVNVKKTCDDLMDYVLVRAPPLVPGLPRPRFSLYLSSQLQYGIILVYHRQCAILLEEIQTILGRLAKNRPSRSINLDDYSRRDLFTPDFLSLLCESEGAQDPFFGVMHLGEAMPIPSTLIQMIGASPEHLGLTGPAPPLEDSFTASPDTITLREREPDIIPTAEFDGDELPDGDPGMIDLLLAQSDNFIEEEAELGREGAAGEERPTEIERERGGREGIKEMTVSIVELQPSTLSSDDAPHQEALTPESRHPSPAEPQVRKRTKGRRPSLEDLPAPERRGRRRRRRQLTFFDQETQLSQEVQQQQINDPLTETRPPPLPRPPSHKMLSATDLLNRPCIFLPEEPLLLWRRAASITALSGSDLQVGEGGPGSTDSERERERKREEAQKEQESQNLSTRKLSAEQDEPYGAIKILRGPNYEEGDGITTPAHGHSEPHTLM